MIDLLAPLKRIVHKHEGPTISIEEKHGPLNWDGSYRVLYLRTARCTCGKVFQRLVPA